MRYWTRNSAAWRWLAVGVVGVVALGSTLGAAHAEPDGQGDLAAPGDPLRIGLDNDAGTSETRLRSDPSGDKATLAIYNEITSCPSPCTHRPDALRVFGSTFGGAAIQAFAGGPYSTMDFPGVAIRGTGSQTGVWGVSTGGPLGAVRADNTGASGNAVFAKGPRAVYAEGGAEGILATGKVGIYGSSGCGSPGCVAVKGVNQIPNGLALQTVGQVEFSTAAIATIPAGQDRITVHPGFDIDASTKVLVTQMSGGGTFRFVTRQPAANTLTLRLSQPATTNVTLAYFIIG
jgi:hypothetical protein